jgi:hypothetical protein
MDEVQYDAMNKHTTVMLSQSIAQFCAYQAVQRVLLMATVAMRSNSTKEIQTGPGS